MKANIALYGKSGSGKTAIAEYLVKKYGYVRCTTGGACRRICRMLFDSESKTLLNKVTDALRAIDSEVWLRAALSIDTEGRPVVFDSMRFRIDYNYMLERGFQFLKVTAPLDVREMRLKARGQEFDPAVDDSHQAEIELADLSFDKVIDNSGTSLTNLYLLVEATLAQQDGSDARSS